MIRYTVTYENGLVTYLALHMDSWRRYPEKEFGIEME